MGKPKEDYT